MDADCGTWIAFGFGMYVLSLPKPLTIFAPHYYEVCVCDASLKWCLANL